MTILYFTTTGNSLAVAKTIGGTLLSVPQLLGKSCHEVSDSEAIGVVCPVYFGRIPPPVERFLRMSVLEAPYTFCILTCGSTPALSVRHLLKIRKFDYVGTILMVDNYFPMFDVEKQVRMLPEKRVDERLDTIVSDISDRRRCVPSPKFYDRVAEWYMRLFPLSRSAYKRFVIDDSRCTRCGVCARVCPVTNVSFGHDGLPEIGSGCLTCGGCYHNCPSGAIRFRGEKSRYSYRNPQVSLNEIIVSNNRIDQPVGNHD